MWFVFSIMGLMFVADVWWWWYADRLIRKTRAGFMWRIFVGVTASIALLGLVLLLFARIIRMEAMIMPDWGVKLIFIWHFIILPIVFIPTLFERAMSGLKRLIVRTKPSEIEVMPSRRAFLAQALAVVPPAAALALTGQAVIDRDDFRINRIDLPLANLPPALEGMTIAHVADPHIGSFMSDAKYKAIIDRTNELDADLVLHAGDLINHSLNDLPEGIQMLRKMRGRYGVYSCQGNHDCIDRRELFEETTQRADIGMLLDAEKTVRINGQKVQILAPRWVARREALVDWSVENVMPLRDPNAFTILLAHHPHAFDAAVAQKVPLTLSGHTHGGQLRLFGDIGFGALMYKYWSGVYRNGDNATVVSNGIGNWFPLRINVPCEIVHLTLRRM